MPSYFDAQGRAIALGKLIGSGGEGAVFEIAGDPRRVAKIYHRPVAPEKADKLRAMAEGAAEDLIAFASWPLSVLSNGRGENVAGILLPRVSRHTEIHNLYSPAHRKIEFPDKDWSFLVHVAMNCAAAFDAIHGRGHVIGDVNQGNVLVSQRGTVFLIDCDSFQVSAPAGVYPCDVGVPQFTPPELQGRNFRGLARTANHDRFGLALVIFHLLYMGRHPFAGRFRGEGDMPIEQAIAEYRYAFGRRAREMEMAPPPQSLDVSQATPDLAELFERAFSPGSELPDARPAAGEWHARLFKLAAKLDVCQVDRGHRFVAGLDCPWCRLMLDGAPNFFLSVTFRATTPEILNVTAEVGALFRTVDASRRPRVPAMPSPPELTSVTPTPPPPAVESAESLAAMVRAVAVVSLLATGGMLFYPPIGLISVPMAVVFTLWWLVMFLASGHRPERQRRRRAFRTSRAELRRWQSHWNAAIADADEEFRLVRKDMSGVRDQMQKLRGQYENELRRLSRDVWQRQLNAFLQTKFISEARIVGIGAGRTATLASYGIETAADVEYNRVLAVPGLDPDTTNNLCAWRSSFERQFHVNRAQGIPVAERQALLLKYAQVRQQLELKLRGGPARLRKVEEELAATLAELEPKIEAAYRDLAQAHVDVEAMSPPKLRPRP
jgi:DNA-binding helix-hairpin-helix protein with protein kinase domain